MTMLYAYLILAADTGHRMSVGITTVDPDPVAAELAAELVERNRGEHSYYTGARTCWVWPYTDDTQALGTLETGPDGADRFDL
ncbi:hypothetical protein OG599_35245 (plasmid) [Streptomyces sp. NBC_01335]|uniref:hypothetical protein n=1 Tax=Streptomyces sp. NBC_01335 TaxID=2903828 RepID=UPI002E138217|nr:hypothetical protein OG599_35245 [Streptomyces sp. NBC_01335]